MEIGSRKSTANEWKLGEKTIKSCESYKYLGVQICRNGKNDENIDLRLKKAKAAV